MPATDQAPIAILVNTAKTIRIPAYMVNPPGRGRRQAVGRTGRAPTTKRCPHPGTSQKKLNIIKKIHANSTPQTDQTENGWSLDEMLMDGNTKTPDTEMVEADDLKHVLEMLERMDKREATVLRMRFGLDEEEPKTLKQIGECLGLTRERVRQIESEALNKLSDGMECR